MKRNNQSITHNLAQSEIVSVVLILGITISGISMITLYGMPTINDMKQNAQIDRVENEFALLDSKISATALGASSTQKLSLNVNSGSITAENNGSWIKVVHTDAKGNKNVLHNSSIGHIKYHNQDTRIYYQGGGVWRKQERGNATIVSPPEFHYQGKTLTLPIINVTNTMSTAGSQQTFSVSSYNTTRIASHSNPLRNGTVNVTVKSEVYMGWANYFNQRTQGKVIDIKSNKNIVKMKLDVPTAQNINNAIVAGDTDDLTVGNKGLVDSYNSSNGPYTVTKSDEGNIISSGTVTLQGSGEVKGNVTAQEDITLQNKQSTLDGDAESNEEVIDWQNDICNNIDGVVGSVDCHKNIKVPEYPVADNEIESMVSQVQGGKNDNNNIPCISGNQIRASTCTLTAGTYYFDSTQTFSNGGGPNSPQQLTLDTTSGDINIVLDGSLEVGKSGSIDYSGTNNVTFYITENLQVGNGGVIRSDANQDATKMIMKIKSGNKVKIQNPGTKVEGLVYAPGSIATIKGTGGGETKVFGSVIADKVKVTNQGKVHFDENLKDIVLSNAKDKVTYIHMTENKVRVDG